MVFAKFLSSVVGLCLLASPASATSPSVNTASFAYKVSHPVAPLPDTVFESVVAPDAVPYAFDAADTTEHPPPDLTFGIDLGPPREMSRDATCDAIVAVARGYDLPVAFFANLIWQESNFNPRDISRAGAQGIAQFMPGTAVDFGLINPFEPIHALNVAARFLTELQARFGNLGLAAAAYNAGPTRITNWMAKRNGLPGETRDYVVRITGKSAVRWTEADVKSDPETTLMPAKAPCTAVEHAVRRQKKVVEVAKLIMALAQTTEPEATADKPAADKPAGDGTKVADTATQGRDQGHDPSGLVRRPKADDEKPRSSRRHTLRSRAHREASDERHRSSRRHHAKRDEIVSSR